MTARVNMLRVVLEKDIRIDNVEPLISAIKQMKGVLQVDTNIATPGDNIAEIRARNELGKKILKIIYPELLEDK